MVDIDKLICDFMSFEYKGEELKELSRSELYAIKTAIWFIGKSLKEALNQQGLQYKEGSIKPIESKPDTLALEKIEKHTLSSIFKGEWYICIKPINYFTVGKIYYAIKDWVLSGDLGDTFDVRWTSDCFRHATKEDIEKQTTRLNPSTIKMLEKPSTIKFDEPDFDNMVKKFLDPDKLRKKYMYLTYQEAIEDAYRKGLEDMYKRLKDKL